MQPCVDPDGVLIDAGSDCETARRLPERLARVYERIVGAGGDPARIKVVAVTKGLGTEAVKAAVENGLSDIGENYARELLSKADDLSSSDTAIAEVTPRVRPSKFDGDETSLRWHFLGSIQRNKVRSLSGRVYCWQGVSRRVEAEEISRWASGAQVMVQVALEPSETRNGCLPARVPELVRSLADLDVVVTGLMAVGPTDPTTSRAAFRIVREIADDLDLVERSMGMTADLEDAVKEGATMLRVGTGLFGERPRRGG
ncbi:MAG: alanine racemase [Actinobacteria bacterium]|nr:alanine racemase [Actinomycetota bacterium]MCL5445059.1 alanine racemase [Actinomycetota bacterium]